MQRKVFVWIAVLGLLGAAFVCFGLGMRAAVPEPMGSGVDTEIYSFDYLGFADSFSNSRYIGYGRFRHPLYHWLMSVVTLMGERVYSVAGERVFWVFLCLVFSAVMLGCLSLMYRFLRGPLALSLFEALSCSALFASFAHVWLLAGMPETYPIALLLSLAVLHCAAMRVEDRRLNDVLWGFFAVLTGGVTLTQGVKTCLAYCVVKRPSRRHILLGVLGVVAAVALVALVFYVRLLIRTHADPTARGMEGAVNELFGPLIGFSVTPGEWFHRVWVFFSEPIIVRGEPFEVRTVDGGYPSLVQPILLAVLYGFVTIGAWLGRHHVILRVMAAMFAVDVLIHFVLGWGLAESQLYSAHWFYVLPVCVGLGIKNMSRHRVAATIAVIALSVAIAACNIYGYGTVMSQ